MPTQLAQLENCSFYRSYGPLWWSGNGLWLKITSPHRCEFESYLGHNFTLKSPKAPGYWCYIRLQSTDVKFYSMSIITFIKSFIEFNNNFCSHGIFIASIFLLLIKIPNKFPNLVHVFAFELYLRNLNFLNDEWIEFYFS